MKRKKSENFQNVSDFFEVFSSNFEIFDSKNALKCFKKITLLK